MDSRTPPSFRVLFFDALQKSFILQILLTMMIWAAICYQVVIEHIEQPNMILVGGGLFTLAYFFRGKESVAQQQLLDRIMEMLTQMAQQQISNQISNSVIIPSRPLRQPGTSIVPRDLSQ